MKNSGTDIEEKKLCADDNLAEIVKDLIAREDGMNQKVLAESLGVVRQNVSQMLNRNRGNMKYENFVKMLEVLGYEIIMRKK